MNSNQQSVFYEKDVVWGSLSGEKIMLLNGFHYVVSHLQREKGHLLRLLLFFEEREGAGSYI